MIFDGGVRDGEAVGGGDGEGTSILAGLRRFGIRGVVTVNCLVGNG